MDDKIVKKLDDIHEDMKGGFHTVHTRLDRENHERAQGMQRISEMWATVMAKVDSLFRRSP